MKSLVMEQSDRSDRLEKSRASVIPPAARILILEESPADADSILRELRNSSFLFEPVHVTSRPMFESQVLSADYSAILASTSLAGWSGSEVLQFVRASGCQSPVLFLAGTVEEEAMLDAGGLEADDVILKDHLVRLPFALKRAVEAHRLRDANARCRSALADAEARNRDFVAHSTYGIFRVSLQGEFIAANPMFLDLLACRSFEELRSAAFGSDVFRYPANFLQLVSTCRERGFVHNVEAEWRRRDGGFLTVRLHVRYLSLPDPPDAIEGVVEDITEIRALERQLLQAQKFETIGQLAGGIAHDFNNVVGAILGWAELGLEQARAYPTIAERFGRIREQADRAASLTRELLAFARRQSLQPRPVDLNQITKNLSSFLDKVIDKSIEIRIVPGTIQSVKADPTQIEQVLMNLCLNARDAMPNGGRLTVETEMARIDETYCRIYPYVSPGSYAVLSVSDTGQGMDAETRERIFEPFFTTKPKGKGTGMGLATVYGIVRQHGGYIHVYSEVGQGSLFRVYLPAMQTTLTAERSFHIPPDPNVAHGLRGTETILIAEDHDSIREMVRQTLANLGYRVLAASDGEDALRLCETESPALAILDVVMPRLGGPAAALKLLERHPNLPIMFTSGYSEADGSLRTQLPASTYLQKPYSPTALGRAIRDILDSAPARSGV